MRPWQWLAVPLAIGLFLCIVVYPFCRYADLETRTAENGNVVVGGFHGWKNGFLSIGEIKRLNTLEPRWSSGQLGNAQPNWLVVIVLVVIVGAVCSYIFGYRPSGDSLRKQAMVESILAFIMLGLSFVLALATVLYGFSWMGGIRTAVAAALGIFLLWASGTRKSRRKTQTAQ